MKTLLIADDLTGALDTGVQLSKKKTSTTVYLGMVERISLESDVIIINSNSRHDNPSDAYAKVANILKKYANQFDLIFLKTDLGLRGNISATFKAGIDVLERTLLFVPAYPSVNRTTKDGVHYIDGQLLQDSIFKHDFPALKTTSHLRDIINHDYEIPTRIVRQDNLSKELIQSLENSSVSVFDCESLNHLGLIVQTLRDCNRLNFIAGCAELAHVISKTVYANVDNRELLGKVLNGPMLLINGSINSVSLNQLKQANAEDRVIIKLNANVLFNKDISYEFKRLKDRLVQALRKNKSVILTTAVNEEEVAFLKTLAKVNNLSDMELSRNIEQKINMIVKSVYSEIFVEKLVIFGGETALGVLQTLEVKDLIPIGEVSMGIPYAIAMQDENKIQIVTKSGALGSEDIINDIERYLNQSSSFLEGTI